jgi:hypothetical protein
MGLFGNSNANATARLHQISVTQSVVGICIPILYGTNRVQINLLDYMDFTSTKESSSGGKGGGGKGGSQWDYHASVIGALCEGQLQGIGNVWGSNGRLTNTSASEPITISATTHSVSNSSTFAQDLGVAVQSAYSITANDFGSSGPATLSGTQWAAMSPVASSPASGQYSVDGSGNYTFNSADIGKTITINYTYSLYTLVSVEDYNVPIGKEITVTNQPSFVSDQGVTYALTNQKMTRVSGTPSVTGTYNPNGGNYLFAPGDVNAAVAISYAWKQNNSDVSSSATLNFTLIEGTQSQSPWSYLTSKHASRALGYSGLALIAAQNMDLGDSATLPNYNYECISNIFGGGIVDSDVASCIIDLLTNPLHGAEFDGTLDASLTGLARNYWNSNGFFISPVIDTQRSAAEIVGEWCEAGNVGPVWSEGVMKFYPYGDTTTVGNGYTYSPQTQPQVDLNDDDFLGDGSSDPVTVERTPWQDAFNSVKVQYKNRINNYNPDIVQEQNSYAIDTFGLRQESQKAYDFITLPTVATFAANLRLKRLCYIRDQYHFTISGVRYGWLEPMDLVTLTDVVLGLNKVPVRITTIIEKENMELEITAEEFPWGTATATINPKQPTAPYQPVGDATDPGNTVPIIFEAPNRLAKYAGNILYIFCNGANTNWGGCQVFVSFDGTNYSPFATVDTPGRVGTLASALAAFTGTNPDTADTLTVNLLNPDSQVVSVSSSDAAAFVTLAAIVNSSYALELVSYQNATLVATGQYALTGLYRGVYGTTAMSHASGEQFARMDDASVTYQYDSSYYGKTIYFKFCSFNLFGVNQQSLANVPAYSFTLQGVGPGTVDLDNGLVIAGRGSIAPAYSGAMSYTSTTGSITWAWNLSVLRTDLGMSTDVLTGSQTVTGLSSGSSYNFYPYENDPNKTFAMVQTGGTGTPAWAHVGTNAAWTQEQARADHCPLSTAPMAASTTSTGSGGGSGGGGLQCLRRGMRVREKSKGVVPVESIVPGDSVLGPHGWRKVVEVSQFENSTWIRPSFTCGEDLDVTPGHKFGLAEGGTISAKELTVEAFIQTEESFTFVDSIKVLRGELDTAHRISLEFDPELADESFLYYAGRAVPIIVNHNYSANPC